ncbi:Histone-lysine N-methyltransferase ASHR1, partial [Tetrabaena socialis]
GRGRGLVTTRSVLPGELLLAVAPLALAAEREPAVGTATAAAVVGEAVDGADAKFLELQRQLLARRYTAREAAWLSSLAGLAPPGDDDSSAEAAAAAQDAAVALLPSPPELAGAEAAGEGRQQADGEAEVLLPMPERLRDPDALADVVQANCLEPDGGAEDEAAFWARREAADAAGDGGEGGGASSAGPRVGPVGLWPVASMLNHSCQPNAVAYLVGDTLLVRATRNVGRDSELTISYLPVGGGVYGIDGGGGGGGGTTAATAAAATLLSPLKERQAALEDGWGFVCGCGRCQAEAALDPKLRTLITEITDTVGALREDFEMALAVSDTGAAGEAASDDDEGEEEEAGGATAGAKAGTRAGADGATEEAAGEEEEGEEGEEGGSRLAVVAE